jgi:AbrB family looped-hinge helix DNA binding protein
MTVKITKSGDIRIPKEVREKLGLAPGTEFELTEDGIKLILTKIVRCKKCGKPLPEERHAHGVCNICDPEFDDGYSKVY